GNGLFRYDGTRTAHVEGDLTGYIEAFHDTSAGLLLYAVKGLFRYDGTRTVHVEGDWTGGIASLHDTPGGLLVDAVRGLFYYDGTRIAHVAGSPNGANYYAFHDPPAGVLLVPMGWR